MWYPEMEAMGSSKMLVLLYQTIRAHIPQDGNLDTKVRPSNLNFFESGQSFRARKGETFFKFFLARNKPLIYGKKNANHYFNFKYSLTSYQCICNSFNFCFIK
jgi:hypothetical protein